MLSLAIDSSQDVCALALGRDGHLVAELHFHHKMNLLRRLMPNVEQILSDSDHSVRDLEAIIISLGPGSFTGLRIGVTIAKTLAYALSLPIVGVGTLDAIARGCAPASVDLICPMIHARTGEVYWSMFDSSGETRLAEYGVDTVVHVMREARKRGARVCFCGSGATRNAEAIGHEFGSDALVGQPWSDFARGAVLLDIGHRRLRDGAIDDPVTLTPLYVKKPTPVVRLESGELGKSGGRGSGAGG